MAKLLARLITNECEHDARDQKCGHGRQAHTVNMAVEVGSGRKGSEVGGIRNGRHFIAEACARDGARDERGRKTKDLPKSGERNTKRGDGSP